MAKRKKTRPGKGTTFTSPRSVLALKRRQIAVALRMQGYTYYQIGQKLKVSHVVAWQYVHDAMIADRKEIAEDGAKIRDMEVGRLDRMLEKLWPRREEARVSDTILRLMDRRAKLLGLDLPSTVNVNVTGLEKLTDDELIQQAEEIARRARKSKADPDDPGGEEKA